MRKVIGGAFMSLDGVMQAPGARDEDTSGGFQYGGWMMPYEDDEVTEALTYSSRAAACSFTS